MSWFKYCHFPVSFIKLIVFAFLSVLVLFSQLHLFFKSDSVQNMILEMVFYQGKTQVYMLYTVVGVFFGYMIVVSIYSIFSIKIFGFYGFYYHNTDIVTFLSFVYYAGKLTYPLCYTVLYAVLGNSNLLKKTAFYNTIGNLKAVPVLGYDVPSYLPILFIFLSVCFIFDCFKKVLKCLGFKVYDYSLEDNNEVTREGLEVLDMNEKTIADDLADKQSKTRPRQITLERQADIHEKLVD